MADNLDDGEFWLPPQFLSDDDAPFSPKNKTSILNNGEDTLLFPSEFPYGFASSDLSSPEDSLVGSSETESSDEEQFVAELTRRMTRSSLQIGSKSSENNSGRFVSHSPQSTLCAIGSGCRCSKQSSQGSPNGVCKVSSLRATYDLLHAAAGEVERMKMKQKAFINNNNYNEAFVPQRKPSPVTLPSKNNTNHEMAFFTQQSLSHQQLQIAQFQMLRQQQIAKQQNSMWGAQKQFGGVYQQRQNDLLTQNRGINGDLNGFDSRNNRTLGLSASAWPTLQHAKQLHKPQNQQYGSGMRAVFLGNASAKRESTGTGVFLPRHFDSPVESRKKPVCSTALVPARVAQALNLKLDDYNIVGCQPQPLHRMDATSVENAAVQKVMGNYVFSQQKRSSINNPSKPQPAVNNEVMLPQEWTY